MKSKCETCYYCKMTNGKCHKNKKTKQFWKMQGLCKKHCNKIKSEFSQENGGR